MNGIGDRPVAGVELGGTKAIAVIAHGRDIIERMVCKTKTPSVTLGAVREQLDRWNSTYDMAAIGIASFGPIRLSAEAPDHGHMLATPKPGWSGADILTPLLSGFDKAFRLDTDVNGAALAEARWGAGSGTDSLCYITIGTGVGGGFFIGGKPVHGALHPELGHLRLRRAPGDDFAGACPFHGDCIEGLISGPALAARFDTDPATVLKDHPGWRHVAWDIAELVTAILLTVSAERVLIGGGVATARDFLLPEVRKRIVDRLSGYLAFVDAGTIDDILQTPALGSDAGPLGAVALAYRALED